jgi:predicted Fe-Mo cluster-binding NifX family protein
MPLIKTGMAKKNKCAVPLLGTRVAPRCMFSSSMLVAEIVENHVASTRTVPTINTDEYRWLELLLDIEVDVIVCGGIPQRIIDILNDYNIQVICNVAGEAEEVIKVFAQGKLHPWFGYGYRDTEINAAPRDYIKDASSPSEAVSKGMDGCSCRVRRLLWNELRQTHGECEISGENGLYLAQIPFSPVCSVSQMRRLFKEKGYRRAGITYCPDFSELAASLMDELNSDIDVVSIVCPANCISSNEKSLKNCPESCCPVDQSETVRKEECDVVVILGMCDAFFTVFNRITQMPVMLVAGIEQLSKARVSVIG